MGRESDESVQGLSQFLMNSDAWTNPYLSISSMAWTCQLLTDTANVSQVVALAIVTLLGQEANV